MKTIVENEELNLKVLVPLAEYLQYRFGLDGATKAAIDAGFRLSDFDGSSRWTSLEKFENFLIEARKLMEDDDEFISACAHKMAQNHPVKLMTSFLSPNAAFTVATRNFSAVCKLGKKTLICNEPGHIILRYDSAKEESTLLTSLSRIAQYQAVPTIWGLPPAAVKRTKCPFNGDSYFEYDIRFYQARRKLPWLGGMAFGLLVGAVLVFGMGLAPPALALCALLGLGVGYLSEVTQSNSVNLRVAKKMDADFAASVQQEEENRIALEEAQERQRSWTRLLEEQVAERTETMSQLTDQLKQLQQHQIVKLRGVSHDMKNPLTAIMARAQFLKDEHRDDDTQETVADILEGVAKLEEMLSVLLKTADTERGLVPSVPVDIDLREFSESIRRRMKAMVYNQDIRTSVIRTREAPESINVDRLIFERVLDNLISNAVKYTSHGSIVVELDGRQGTLTVKVSDTGRGIHDHEIHQIFEAESRLSSPRAAKSHGLGLSVVVRLMAQIGGDIEVMSRPEVGTTFWANFPVSAERVKVDDASSDDMLAKVVHIRDTGARG